MKIEFYQQRVSLDPEQEADHIIILISLQSVVKLNSVGPIHVLLYNYYVKYVLANTKNFCDEQLKC